MESGKEEITAVILAGGRSSRMAYQDKGLVAFKQQPMIVHILQRLQQQVTEVLISANHNQNIYRQYVERVIADDSPNFPGPMAGICASLRAIRSKYLLIVPCDGPLLPLDLAQRLYFALEKSEQRIATVHDGHYKQPTYSLIHREMLGSAEDFLERNERKLGKWLQLNRAELVDFSDQATAFVNINSRDELLRVEKLAD